MTMPIPILKNMYSFSLHRIRFATELEAKENVNTCLHTPFVVPNIFVVVVVVIAASP